MDSARLLAADFPGRVLDTLNNAIICLDRERRIIYINATGEAMFGQSASKVAGRRFNSLLS